MLITDTTSRHYRYEIVPLSIRHYCIIDMIQCYDIVQQGIIAVLLCLFMRYNLFHCLLRQFRKKHIEFLLLFCTVLALYTHITHISLENASINTVPEHDDIEKWNRHWPALYLNPQSLRRVEKDSLFPHLNMNVTRIGMWWRSCYN